MNNFHTPVLLKEVIEFLNIKTDKKYIDTTVGGGGHTLEILKRGGRVLGIDCDQEAIDYVREKVKSSERLTLVHGNFKDIREIARLNGFEKVAGILFDLGVSSYQLEDPLRGFSFQRDGPLDMRMDKSLLVKALDLVNGLSKGELYELFIKLGEERYARAISGNIIRARRVKPIETTKELALIVEQVYGVKRKSSLKGKALANKRVFQALRIAVNDELNNLEVSLPEAASLLEERGRLLAISFHSLEDRIVKNSFNKFQEKDLGRVLTKKPVEAGSDELRTNKKARSAKLRVFEKL